jgi:hypothetical protein
MTADELALYYVKQGHWGAVRRILDDMSPRELRMAEVSVRELSVEIKSAQLRKRVDA